MSSRPLGGFSKPMQTPTQPKQLGQGPSMGAMGHAGPGFGGFNKPMQTPTQPKMQGAFDAFNAQLRGMQPPGPGFSQTMRGGLGNLASFGGFGFNKFNPMQPPMQPMTQPPMQPMTQPPMQPPMQPFGMGDGGAGLDPRLPPYAQAMQQLNAIQGQQVGNTGQMAGPMVTQFPMQPMTQPPMQPPMQPMTQPQTLLPSTMPGAPNMQQVMPEPPRMQASRNMQRTRGYNR